MLKAERISKLCRRLRIPVNVVDAPHLCTFTLLSTHSDGPLQIGITTSGNGCKLALRIRREIASSLPQKLGVAVERLGRVRRRIWEEDHRGEEKDEDDSDAAAQKSTFNRLVSESDKSVAATRRMRWLSQICEYWSLTRLAAITEAEIDTILESYASTIPTSSDLTKPTIDDPTASTRQEPGTELQAPSKPDVILAGSGPGSPFLLTLATYRAMQTASLVLADKLVPPGILDLIPRRTTIHIARKFPGNADAAQAELLFLGLEALQRGQTVLRLKQGDPYIYGRGGEEYIFFSEKGYDPIVLPGITSALSAPLFAAIPATQRAVADQVIICTGTGRKGAAPDPPGYIPTQTVVFLMALHRLPELIASLLSHVGTPAYTLYPVDTPCAVIERASCHDQRVIRSTLQHICGAVEEEGSRPPGLLVVGWSCHVLVKPVSRGWVVEEGFRGLGGLAEGGIFDIRSERGLDGGEVQDSLQKALRVT